MAQTSHTPGPWEYVPGTEYHGPYVANQWGAGDICDCYAMSNPSSFSVRNGGDSRPINHQHDEAEANARLIAAAPDMLAALHRADRAIVELYRAACPHGNYVHGNNFADNCPEMGVIRAAIAKAAGSTNA